MNKLLPIEIYALESKNEELILKLLETFKDSTEDENSKYFPSSEFIIQCYEFNRPIIKSILSEIKFPNFIFQPLLQSTALKKDTDFLLKLIETYKFMDINSLKFILELHDEDLEDAYFSRWFTILDNNQNSFYKVVNYLKDIGKWNELERKYTALQYP